LPPTLQASRPFPFIPAKIKSLHCGLGLWSCGQAPLVQAPVGNVKRCPSGAARWLTRLFATITTLADMPARCPIIPEADELGRPLRHLLYGRRTGTYRIIFDIQEDSEEGPRVRVLRIWRAVRDAIAADDLEIEH